VPQFAGERPVNRKGATDFNDLHVMPAGGLQQVAAQVEASILAQGWQAQVNVARVAHARGAGNGGTPSLKPLLTVDEAAARYALCYASRGTLYDAQERVLVNKDDVRDLLPDHGWREWKTHPARRVVRMRDVGFDPTETDPTITCNLYSGWPTEPKAGQCDRLLSLLSYLCSGDGNAADVYEWVLRWLAYPIQHPGAKMRTALVMHGPQGAGKNLIFEAVMSIYGQYGRIIDQAAVEDKFNDWASRKLFLIADEVVARAELFHIKNKLKGLVTGDWIRINEKNVAAHDERNHVNLVFLSNEKQPLVLDEDDRRYVVIWTPAGISPQFYAEVAQELAAGGAAALHHFLLELDLGDFGPHTKPPSTEARRDLIELGRDSVSIFVRDWLAGETPYPVMPALSSDFYEGYSRHCRKSGEPRPRTHNQFAGDIRKRPGWSLEPRHVFEDTVCYGATKPKRIVIPPVAALQAAGNEQPPGEPLSKWLTRSFFAFNRRLQGL
jgi:putative DNA primase/helicase